MPSAMHSERGLRFNRMCSVWQFRCARLALGQSSKASSASCMMEQGPDQLPHKIPAQFPNQLLIERAGRQTRGAMHPDNPSHACSMFTSRSCVFPGAESRP